MSSTTWGTTRESVTAWLTRYGALKFTAAGTVPDSRKRPKLATGDAVAIVKAAGLAEDTELEGTAIEADDAISAHRDNLDSGASGEDLRDSREWRDGYVEEFIGELRKRLLPEAVAAEEAELERRYPRIAGPLPGGVVMDSAQNTTGAEVEVSGAAGISGPAAASTVEEATERAGKIRAHLADLEVLAVEAWVHREYLPSPAYKEGLATTIMPSQQTGRMRPTVRQSLSIAAREIPLPVLIV